MHAVPPVLNYAGQVAVNGEAFDGNGLFKFALVNADGTTTYWSNDGTSVNGSEPQASVAVPVNGGLYSILLGNTAQQGMGAIDPAVFAQHNDAKLRVWFSDGVNGFQQLSPDRSFASVPYAFSAETAGSAHIAPGSIVGPMLDASLLADLNASIGQGSITRSMLEASIIDDLNASITDGSISTAKMDPNLVRYFVPEISLDPSAVSIIQGTDTTLSVQAEGKFLTYQWQKNGVNLVGKTTSSLNLNNTTAIDDANYSVLVSNDWGTVSSLPKKVTVATALPAITILGSTTLTHEATTLYTDSGATAVDALGGDLTSSITITSADINVTELGNQIVTYSVTDAGGNTNTSDRTVIVQDTINPVITVIGDSNLTHNLNTAWVEPGYYANDSLDGNLTTSVSISGAIDVNTTGAYVLTYSVVDQAGNKVDENRTVNVIIDTWDKTFGGTAMDQCTSVISANDGGYLMLGFTRSGANGDKSEGSKGNTDFWVVKTDATGNKVWDKTLGSGNHEYARSAISTSDGGYLLVGHSDSGAGGDKTQSSRGRTDFWVIKIDANGNKLWDQRYGAPFYDDAQTVIESSDGNYIILGHTDSPAGGDKSLSSKGRWDFWAVKIDTNGNKLWEKGYGGSFHDNAYSALLTDDGGYLFFGNSESPASGDKSQGNQGVDYWVIKVDANGNKIWDETFGGSGNEYGRTLLSTNDSGYLLIGYSNSGISGNKTQANKGGYDFWVVKIDANGNKLWDKSYGGTGNDYAYSSLSMNDGSYLLAGCSSSGANGDKTQGSLGNNDYWVIKIDANGNKLWDRAYGGSASDELRSITSTGGGGVLLAGYSSSVASGFKTEGRIGSTDYWIIKINAN